jgi:hypothetical protein
MVRYGNTKLSRYVRKLFQAVTHPTRIQSPTTTILIPRITLN